MDINALARHVCSQERCGQRRVIGLAGAPASGKSTLAAHLADALCRNGVMSQVVPMDGFHLDNSILEARGILDRKGAPETFDASGFLSLVTRLSDGADVYYPEFDRARDIAIAGAGCVEENCDTLIVEGNYLLLDQPIWRDLRSVWDMSIMLHVPEEQLLKRLVNRWLDYGLPSDQAEARARGNDLTNARHVLEASLPADLTL